MIIFGLTGGIACGKSTVTKTFRKHEIPIVDADIIARQVVAVGTNGYFQVLRAFGKEFFLEDGSLDRPKMAQLVFSEKTAMKKMNDIMGPLIHDESVHQFYRWHNHLLDNKRDLIVGYDAALICEMGNAKKYRPLIVVSCPQATQVERLMKRNSLTHAEAMARITAQMPVAEKVAMADYVVDTSRTVEESILQTEFIIKQLKEQQ